MVDLVPAAVLTVLMLFVFRFVLFWGIAIIPVVVRAVSLRDDVSPPRMSWLRKGLTATILAMTAIVPTIGMGVNLKGYYPLASIAAMKDAGVRGTIYCNQVWGGVVIDSGYPQWRVTHDGRFYLYSQAELEQAAAALQGKVAVAELESRYQPAAFLLWPGPDDPLIGKLRESARMAVIACGREWRGICPTLTRHPKMKNRDQWSRLFAGERRIMSEFTTVARVGEIADGHGKAFPIDDRMVVVFYVDEKYYALDDCCPHMGAPLHRGEIKDGLVICDRHQLSFRLTDGTCPNSDKLRAKNLRGAGAGEKRSACESKCA